VSGGNSKFNGSCEDAESLNLSGQNSGCDLNLIEQNYATGAAALNFKNKNSAATSVEAASKTADAAEIEAAMSAVEAKMTKNSAKRY
jgi:hypothetical protein